MKRVEKPWGHEMIWAVTDRYVGKVLHIKAGQKLSLQYHRQKDETVMVWKGRMEFEHFEDGQPPRKTVLEPGQAFRITPGLRHRMIAIEDTGSGLSAEQLARLFQPFERLGHESPPTLWASSVASSCTTSTMSSIVTIPLTRLSASTTGMAAIRA